MDSAHRGARYRVSTPRAAGNLFADLPDARREEILDTLAEMPGMRLVRIVSAGESSPQGQWYDQPETEWVVLLAGSAVLRFEDEPQPRPLSPGDHILIPPHARHRVESTDPDQPTIWLALHFGPQS